MSWISVFQFDQISAFIMGFLFFLLALFSLSAATSLIGMDHGIRKKYTQRLKYYNSFIEVFQEEVERIRKSTEEEE